MSGFTVLRLAFFSATSPGIINSIHYTLMKKENTSDYLLKIIGFQSIFPQAFSSFYKNYQHFYFL